MTQVHHRFVEIDGQQLFYREAGDAEAPVVVLLHGVLVVDEREVPMGWLRPRKSHRLTSAVEVSDLVSTGTVVREGSSAREFLDAVLSSPSARGVVVGEDGRLTGTVSADQVVGAVRQGTRW
jgi:osmoprotectant transport system ATP-binding protein